MKTSIKQICVLLAIVFASGALLGVMNKITYVDMDKEILKTFSADCGEEFSSDSLVVDKKGNVKYFAVSEGDTPTYALYAKGTGGYHGAVYVYVYIKDGNIIKIAEGENSETFFKKLDKANYFSEFTDKGLNITDVDFVAGATKSSTAVYNAVKNALEYYQTEVAAK